MNEPKRLCAGCGTKEIWFEVFATWNDLPYTSVLCDSEGCKKLKEDHGSYKIVSIQGV